MTESSIQSSNNSHIPYLRAAAASAATIALEFHTKHVTNTNKTKHIMKISHISVNIYDKTATSQQNSD